MTARCALHAGNLAELEAIVQTARDLGFDHVSFLPIDASSDAFGARPRFRAALLPAADRVLALDETLSRLEASRDGFVLDPPARLRWTLRHLAASAGHGRFERPACDAPWWSIVVEADGALRPCFFHAAFGDARKGLARARASDAYARALRRIRGSNTTCSRCVCPKLGAPEALRPSGSTAH